MNKGKRNKKYELRIEGVIRLVSFLLHNSYFLILLLLLIVFAAFAIVHQVSAQGIDTAGLSIPKADISTVQKLIDAVKGVFNAIVSWLMARGIDIGRLIKLMGELVALMIQSLIKLAHLVIDMVRNS